MPVNIGLYGTNGHQIHQELVGNPLARLVALAEFPREKLPEKLREDPQISFHPTYDDLLADPHVDLVSLCSPRRLDQAGHAVAALRAGKHVYAEKPCAMTEADLDEVIRVSRETGKQFHEMAGTAFGQPYFAMREVVREGRIGEVIQVIAEKSYPCHSGRAQDEALDGGLIGQCAIHAVRLVEHAAGRRISSVHAAETTLGNPVPEGGLRMASVMLFTLENGGLASVVANYLNQPGTGIWGDESLKILGTRGLVESTRGGTQTRLVIGENDLGPLDLSAPGFSYMDLYFKTLLGEGTMPLTQEEELSPTRWTIRAKDQILAGPMPARI